MGALVNPKCTRLVSSACWSIATHEAACLDVYLVSLSICICLSKSVLSLCFFTVCVCLSAATSLSFLPLLKKIALSLYLSAFLYPSFYLSFFLVCSICVCYSYLISLITDTVSPCLSLQQTLRRTIMSSQEDEVGAAPSSSTSTTEDVITVTIGATVPTGFEYTAAEEVKEKFGVEATVSKNRGRIFFPITSERLNQV